MPLGPIGIDRFLAEYWQRKPLLVRGALPDFTAPFTADELAGLALEEDVESRLIRETRGRFTLRRGPFAEADFAALPTTRWTLLVQAVDQWVPAVTALRERFRFLPDWRLDDVMVSYAVPGGSVGPHWDNYDVFLVQGMGRRRWQVGGACGPDSPLQPNPDLRLLAALDPVETWDLDPGDMLYLPPGIAHHGIALDACMTFSIGFRAPSAADVLTGYAEAAAARLDDARRFTDPGRPRAANPGEIDAASLDRLATLLADLAGDGEALADWFGRFATEPKYEHSVRPRRRRTAAAALVARIEAGAGLARNPGSRLAFAATADGVRLFADGTALPAAGAAADLARLACAETRLDAARLRPFLGDAAAVALLLALVDGGALLPA